MGDGCTNVAAQVQPDAIAPIQFGLKRLPALSDVKVTNCRPEQWQ